MNPTGQGDPTVHSGHVSEKPVERRELWRQRIAQQGKSGQSIRVFCGEQGLSETGFYAWRKRLRSESKPATEQKKHRSRELAKLEQVITETLSRAYMVVGPALRKIHDGKLYKDNYRDWDDYNKRRWKWSGQQGYNYIEAADVLEDVKDVSVTIPNLVQAKMLFRLPSDTRRSVAETTDFEHVSVREFRKKLIRASLLDDNKARPRQGPGDPKETPEPKQKLIDLIRPCRCSPGCCMCDELIGLSPVYVEHREHKLCLRCLHKWNGVWNEIQGAYALQQERVIHSEGRGNLGHLAWALGVDEPELKEWAKAQKEESL